MADSRRGASSNRSSSGTPRQFPRAARNVTTGREENFSGPAAAAGGSAAREEHQQGWPTMAQNAKPAERQIGRNVLEESSSGPVVAAGESGARGGNWATIVRRTGSAGRQGGRDVGQSCSGPAGAAGGSARPQGDQRPRTTAAQRTIPAEGRIGRNVRLLCNHFMVTLSPLPKGAPAAQETETLYQYTVSIELIYSDATKAPKPVKNAVLSRKVMAEFRHQYERALLGDGWRFIAYDGQEILYGLGELCQEESRPVRLPAVAPSAASSSTAGVGARDFIVKIKKSESMPVTMNTLHQMITTVRPRELGNEALGRETNSLQLLHVLLKEHASKREGSIILKDSFFHPDFGWHNIGFGVDTWKGYRVSFRPTYRGVSLNFDVSNTLVFQPGKLDQVLGSLREDRTVMQFTGHDWNEAEKFCKGLLIQTSHTKRRYRIWSLSARSCDALSFEHVGRKTTVTEYFQSTRNISITGSLRAVNVAQPPHTPVYIPIELCSIIEGQRFRKELNTKQRQKQISYTRQSPSVRRQLIENALRNNHYSNNENLRYLHLGIEENMTETEGRVLDPPLLIIGGERTVLPQFGAWPRPQIRQARFTLRRPVNIPNWVMVRFLSPRDRRQAPRTEDIRDDLVTACRRNGLHIANVKRVFVEGDNTLHLSAEQRVREMVHRAMSEFSAADQRPGKTETPLIVALLPDKTGEIYVPFKRYCEVQVGIVTQCLVSAQTAKTGYFDNVCLKINMKRGGNNFALGPDRWPKISPKDTIIFGLDVCHGSATDSKCPSVAAVVASTFDNFDQYQTSVSAQPSKMELIDNLEGMVRDLLRKHINFCHQHPSNILVFRDGVSESQFKDVSEKEFPAFEGACKFVGCTPKITVVVVQKRHHTRFFPFSAGAAAVGNIEPGTIVDAHPCHPGFEDFYLCSHALVGSAPTGTVRPTYYHVLKNHIGFTPNEIQQLTYNLCYTFNRCKRAVSMVAPTFYADLAAKHCHDFVKNVYYNLRPDEEPESVPMSTYLPPLHGSVLEKMFYA